MANIFPSKEELGNTWTHLIGVIFALSSIWMVWPAIDTSWQMAFGVFFFIIGMFLMFLSSTIYHWVRPGVAKEILRKCDHSSIYVMIACSLRGGNRRLVRMAGIRIPMDGGTDRQHCQDSGIGQVSTPLAGDVSCHGLECADYLPQGNGEAVATLIGISHQRGYSLHCRHLFLCTRQTTSLSHHLACIRAPGRYRPLECHSHYFAVT